MKLELKEWWHLSIMTLIYGVVTYILYTDVPELRKLTITISLLGASFLAVTLYIRLKLPDPKKVK